MRAVVIGGGPRKEKKRNKINPTLLLTATAVRVGVGWGGVGWGETTCIYTVEKESE